MEIHYEQAQKILDKAKDLLMTKRHNEHGDFMETGNKVSELWSKETGHHYKTSDVFKMMALVKQARNGTGNFNLDNYLDQINYTTMACVAYQIENRDATTSVKSEIKNIRWNVLSSDGETEYEMTRQLDGTITCECKGYEKRQTCRHVKEHLDENT